MSMLDKKEIQNIISQFNKKKHNDDHSVQIENVILIALSSAIGGALLGVLFAPEKGKNTRKNLAKKRDEYLQDIKKSTEELSQQLKRNTDSILERSKENAKDLIEDVEDYSELTFQELYDQAKELKIKGYSQMNKSELIQAMKDQLDE